jgi:hypothetical protein
LIPESVILIPGSEVMFYSQRQESQQRQAFMWKFPSSGSGLL